MKWKSQSRNSSSRVSVPSAGCARLGQDPRPELLTVWCCLPPASSQDTASEKPSGQALHGHGHCYSRHHQRGLTQCTCSIVPNFYPASLFVLRTRNSFKSPFPLQRVHSLPPIVLQMVILPPPNPIFTGINEFNPINSGPCGPSQPLPGFKHPSLERT